MFDTGKIFSTAHFTEQLSKFWEEYGLIWLTATIVGGITIGLLGHYFNHTAPMTKVKQQEKKEEEDEQTEEEIDDEEIEESKEAKKIDGNEALDRHLQACFGRAGIMKGSINRNLITGLPKRSLVDKSERGLAGAMADIAAEREELLSEDQPSTPSNPASVNEEEEQSDGVDEVSESEIEEILTEGVLAEEHRRLLNKEVDAANCETEHSERDQLNMLGNLHGKLATAQLRAKTRKMTQDMSDEERQTEADMKARQLESIMNLMLKNQEKFGLSSDEVKEQLNLYNF